MEEAGAGLSVRITDGLSFPIPAARADRYRRLAKNGKLLLGLRPEHITEAGQHIQPGEVPFEAHLDVTEPMGMETLVLLPPERNRRSAAASTRMPGPRTVRRCALRPTLTTCT